MAHEYARVAPDEWVSFPGGELEGRRPRTLCPACREALKREALASSALRSSRPSSLSRRFGLSRPSSPSRPLCFQCYRADLDRERAIAAAGRLNTGSDARFQYQLPLEPINQPRLEALKAARADARVSSMDGVGVYADKRRRAQIAARHALQAIAEGLRARRIAAPPRDDRANERANHRASNPKPHLDEMFDAIHAAELQLPEAWLPFVVSR
jgi:hypothetical protein